MPTTLTVPEQRIVLRNVSWETYERLISEHADCGAPRFTYDRGALEIMSPSEDHERYNLKIADLLGAVADEMDIEVEGLGCATFRREELERGFEADSCFYVQHREKVQGKEHIDLETDPPPDLVIEIDITHPSIDKLALYAKFGVPEVWRYDGVRLEIFRWVSGGYEAAQESAVFPGVSAAAVTELMRSGKALGRTGWLRLCRTWAHEQQTPNP
jgi:Uma2 family endonuclease